MDNVKSSEPMKKRDPYGKFSQINGAHAFRDAVPKGYVDYETRTRNGGRVFFFNFDLAKEMGLIRKNHPNSLNRDLSKAILDAFSFQIINEYDLIHETPIPDEERRPGKVMATRYLQLQHPSNKGVTSGDGRSIWNGEYKGGGFTWDITSCGTGNTCLSPATAIEGDFFKTGDTEVSYGSGYSDFSDGVCEAIMSEIIYENQLKTTRLLAVVAFDDETSINVRVAKNLLRPAHFFNYLKQGDYEQLEGGIRFYIERQIKNKEWPRIKGWKARYEYLLERVTKDFAEAVAQFELEYLFCWLDWDGDNILMDAAIIDYGSVRQFGLFHNRYRYDDVDKMSTTITEQKNMAKYIVQTFAQLVDYLITGKKKNIKQFRRHASLKLFDETFEITREAILLYKIGFDKRQREAMLQDKSGMADLREFWKLYRYFEKVKSRRGEYKVEDGITWDAIFCIRDIMRELPKFYLKDHFIIPPREFLEILKTIYASKRDLRMTKSRREKILEFQKLYRKLIERAADLTDATSHEVLEVVVKRSELINRFARVTGDAIIHVSGKLIRSEKNMDSEMLYRMFQNFVTEQILCPEYFEKLNAKPKTIRSKHPKKVLNSMFQVVEDCREGI